VGVVYSLHFTDKKSWGSLQRSADSPPSFKAFRVGHAKLCRSATRWRGTNYCLSRRRLPMITTTTLLPQLIVRWLSWITDNDDDLLCVMASSLVLSRVHRSEPYIVRLDGIYRSHEWITCWVAQPLTSTEHQAANTIIVRTDRLRHRHGTSGRRRSAADRYDMRLWKTATNAGDISSSNVASADMNPTKPQPLRRALAAQPL